MMNSNIIKVVKIGSLVCSVIGMIGSAWAGSQENKLILADLVKDQLSKS